MMPPAKDIPVPLDAPIEERLRNTIEYSRDVVRRAHERAEQALERAARIREALRRSKAASAEPGNRKAETLMQLAAEESARSVREKERFIAVLSHELRQPLNAALAAAQVAQITSSAAESERARAIIHRQLQQMAVLLDDLTELSRLTLRHSDLRLEPVDLADVMRAAAESVAARAEEKSVVIDLSAPPDCRVVGDRVRLYQVFANLLANAVRYTPASGRVDVAWECSEHAVAAVVRDTGQGIEPEYLPHIFEPLARGGERGGEGLGLGLALVRSIVELHGGTVKAESPGAGRGSSFTVVLPRKITSKSPS